MMRGVRRLAIVMSVFRTLMSMIGPPAGTLLRVSISLPITWKCWVAKCIIALWGLRVALIRRQIAMDSILSGHITLLMASKSTIIPGMVSTSIMGITRPSITTILSAIIACTIIILRPPAVAGAFLSPAVRTIW